MTLRLIGGSVFGLLVTLLLFSFMVQLVMTDTSQAIFSEAVTQMRFIEPAQEPPLESEAQTEESTAQESAEPLPMDQLIPVVSAPIAAQPALSEVAVAEPLVHDFAPDIAAPKSTWSVPVSGDGFNEGEKGKGFIEVVPLATRRPNIPEQAWQHKIDGWVRVAFRLTKEGRTADVRVLDANPGGIFEENVIRAVEDWLYDMRELDHKGDLILTQKIELFWRDYPDNSPYLD